MEPINVVIMDLDDTLWDWVDIWYKSFKAMLDKLQSDSGIPRQRLIEDFKAVFQKHGTTEYAFAIEEMQSLREKHPKEDLSIVYKGAIKAFRKARRAALCTYPTVTETLESLRSQGVLLIGYTESMSFYTRYRLRKLNLDCLLNYLYSPKDHELPENMDPKKIRYYSPENYNLRGVVHRFTPVSMLKPSPEVLLGILRDIGAKPDRTIYVGDKLHKDISMAKKANVGDVWAKYGEAKDRAEYKLLRKVTHWSDEAVQKEKDTAAEDVKPTYILRNYFSELLENFDFAPFVDTTSANKLNAVVETWKKTVEVQQHFNDIELKIRNFAITVLIAAMGAAGFALKEKLAVRVVGIEVPLATILLIAGAVGVVPLWFMDRHWYHRLLYGAVKHAISIEQRHSRDLPELRLSQTIKEESPIRLWRWELHSTRKLDLFYCIIAIILIAGAVVTFLCKPTALEEAMGKKPAQVAPQNMTDSTAVEQKIKDLVDSQMN